MPPTTSCHPWEGRLDDVRVRYVFWVYHRERPRDGEARDEGDGDQIMGDRGWWGCRGWGMADGGCFCGDHTVIVFLHDRWSVCSENINKSWAFTLSGDFIL